MDALGNVYPQLAECALIAATAIGSNAYELDLRNYFVTPGNREVMATLAVIAPVSASLTSLTCKFMQSSVSTTGGYVDVTGGGFTASGALAAAAAASIQTIWFGTSPIKPFLRIYHTISGKATVVSQVFMVKRWA